MDHNKLWKILKGMVLPDQLTCLLRNLYAGQEATVRTGHGTTDWFEIVKGVCQGCILSPCLFNLYAEYIMRNYGHLKCPQIITWEIITFKMLDRKTFKGSLWVFCVFIIICYIFVRRIFFSIQMNFIFVFNIISLVKWLNHLHSQP